MLSRFLITCLVALALPAGAFCNPVNLGYLSYDAFIPSNFGAPGVNIFTLFNLTGDPGTGGYAFSPDFPVMDSVVFQNSSIKLTSNAGELTVSLGDIGPGLFDSTTLLTFAETTTFSSARFTATLSTQNLNLADGSVFTAASNFIDVELLPATGNYLVPGNDLVLVTATDTPEPGTFLLIGIALVGLAIFRNKVIC